MPALPRRRRLRMVRPALAGALVAGLSACALTSGGGSTVQTAAPDANVRISFVSLAYQDSTIAAVEDMVARWNAEHPETQVDLSFGSWDSSTDALVTGFQGGTAPDVIHNESGVMQGFGRQGYLADLSPYLSQDTKDAVSEDLWTSVTVDDQVIGVPLMSQTYVVFANTAAFEEAGVEVPTGDALTWDDFEGLAESLSAGDTAGVGWGLRTPTATIMNTSLGFGGTWFDVADDGTASIHVDEAELQVPERIVHMIDQGWIDPVSVTQSGSDTLTGFFAGDYPMLVGGNFLAEQIVGGAPDGFEWTVLPALAGSDGTAQATNPQTLSVSAESPYQDRAAAFVDYAMSPDNLSAMALGDWMIPTTPDAVELATTGREDIPQWDLLLQTGTGLTGAPFTRAQSYQQWADQYATPSFQALLAGSITIDQMRTQVTEGWDQLD